MTTAINPSEKFKLVFLGEEAVGKTSIIKQFIFDSFSYSIKSTIEVDILRKTIRLKDRTVQLLIWDTPGQERFRAATRTYIRGSTVAVVVYDVTNARTFHQATTWIDDVRNELETNVIIVLVGNKTDLSERQVDIKEGEKKAKELNVMFTETSAKAKHNIEELFRRVATALPRTNLMENKRSKGMQKIVLRDNSNRLKDTKCGCAC